MRLMLTVEVFGKVWEKSWGKVSASKKLVGALVDFLTVEIGVRVFV